MIITEVQKTETWAYFESLPKRQRPHGLTDRRLVKAKSLLWNDEFFWMDIVLRHGLDKDSPGELQEKEPQVYDHLVGNFWGQVIGILYDTGVLKA